MAREINKQSVLVDFNDRIDAEFLNAHPHVKVIGSNTTGSDHIDQKECNRREIKVITLGTYPRDPETEEFMKTITSAAEFTFIMILGLMRSLGNKKLYGKNLGIIGLGRIGTMVRKYAEAFGMDVFWYDQNKKGNRCDEVLAISDVVTVHIPLAGNECFITKQKLKKMKPTAFLINTSRTKVIDSKALLWALRNKIIAGAAVDFMDDVILVEYARDNKNLILTDHVAGSTIDDKKLTEEFILKKMSEFLVKS